MQRRVKFTITGHGEGTDAPNVEDMLDQLRDFIDILRGVEEAASGSSVSAIVWRVVDAKRNSPLALEIEPFARDYATNIDQRVNIVISETAYGLATLQHRPERPKYFTDPIMRKVQRTFNRVTNGIERSGIDFGTDLPKMDITATAGRNASRNVELVLTRPDRPYRELGSLEGYLQSVERDGFGRRVVHIRDRITGDLVKCLVDGEAAQTLETLEVKDVWRSQRIVASGMLFFRSLGSIDHIIADSIRILKARSDVPSFADIVDPDFTGGLSSVEYLEKLRDGSLS